MRELTAAVAELDADATVRVVAITGAGAKAFVAGADIAEMQGLTPAPGPGLRRGRRSPRRRHRGLAEGVDRRGQRLRAGRRLRAGAGLRLHLRLEKARFGQPEVKLGVIPGFGGTQRLARRVGVAKAKELCVTGDLVTAAEALRIGLVDAVVAPEALLPTVRELAGRIAANGPLAVAAAKRCIHRGQSMTLADALALEQREFGALFATADQKEGMAAFLGKRPAQFTGS
jgi:enoyl-CoA hydratase